MKRWAVLTAMLGVLAASNSSLVWSAEEPGPSGEDIARRDIEHRAVEAVIWGMPAVNFDLLYQAMVHAGGAWNQIVYWSRPLDWKNQTLPTSTSGTFEVLFRLYGPLFDKSWVLPDMERISTVHTTQAPLPSSAGNAVPLDDVAHCARLLYCRQRRSCCGPRIFYLVPHFRTQAPQQTTIKAGCAIWQALASPTEGDEGSAMAGGCRHMHRVSARGETLRDVAHF
jgi:hypothetical protein